MTKVNQKLSASILGNLKSIEENIFDETNIKILLIDIRDFSNKFYILKEICHFIAHTERSKGFCQANILSRYRRINYSQTIMKKIDFSDATPDTLFEDLYLKAADLNFYNSIDKEYFESVFVTGLADFEENFWTDKFGASMKEIGEFIKRNYENKKGKYLMTSRNKFKTQKIMLTLHSTIQFRPLITQEKFIFELTQTLKSLQAEIKISDTSLKAIAHFSNDIFSCVLCLLHDVVFTSNNIPIAKTFIAPSENNLSLCCEFKPAEQPITFSLFHSNASIKDYGIEKVSKYSFFEKFPYTKLVRDSNGQLVLA